MQSHRLCLGSPVVSVPWSQMTTVPTVCIDGGKPNQLVVEADARAWGY